jgi:PTS system mannose-specific IIA component
VFAVLIVTHGNLATELLAAAEVIGGRRPGVEALALDWSEGMEQARARIAAGIERLDRGQGVLVMTDMLGDTPSNAAAALARPGRVEVIAGVNLPMIVRLGCADVEAMPVAAAAQLLEQRGRRSIGRVTGREAGEASGIAPTANGGPDAATRARR